MKVLRSAIFRALCAIIVGVLLIQYREQTVTWITIAIGVLFFLSGIISLATYYGAKRHFDGLNNITVTDAEGNVAYVENETAIGLTGFNNKIYNYWDAGGDMMGSSFLIDKSYVKLRSVVLSYELPKAWFKDFFVKNVVLSAYGSNLFVWTPASNTFVDPELTSFGNDLEGNFGEYSANPSSRHFGFNLKFNF